MNITANSNDAVQASHRLAVLLATHNGATFLDQQLQSVAQQDWPSIDIWASDDASSDKTPEMLARWAGRWRKGAFTLVGGPGNGFAGNFRSLLANPDIHADYVAFCDQDDIWLHDKSRAAIEALAPGGDRPALYCSRTIVVDEAGRDLDKSPWFRKPARFENAVVQNIGGGNTMVMNRAAHQLLREAARRTDFVSHDWFAYMIVSGAGGVVTYSEVPRVRYRQHPGNLVGSNLGWAARLQRIRFVLGGRFVDWNSRNLKALDACRDLLTPQAKATMDTFKLARRGSFASRLYHLRRSGVYRQSLAGQVSLYVAGFLGKL